MLNDEKFKKAIERILEFEGGYVNDPSNAGGETKHGISRRSYQNLDIRNLSLDGAKLLYYRDFWEPQLYRDFESVELAEKVFDLAVNVGANKAHLLLQRALRAVGNPVKEDGILGKVTLAAAVVMWFTPDYVDAIIEVGLAAIGISKLIIKKSRKC